MKRTWMIFLVPLMLAVLTCPSCKKTVSSTSPEEAKKSGNPLRGPSGTQKKYMALRFLFPERDDNVRIVDGKSFAFSDRHIWLPAYGAGNSIFADLEPDTPFSKEVPYTACVSAVAMSTEPYYGKYWFKIDFPVEGYIAMANVGTDYIERGAFEWFPEPRAIRMKKNLYAGRKVPDDAEKPLGISCEPEYLTSLGRTEDGWYLASDVLAHIYGFVSPDAVGEDLPAAEAKALFQESIGASYYAGNEFMSQFLADVSGLVTDKGGGVEELDIISYLRAIGVFVHIPADEMDGLVELRRNSENEITSIKLLTSDENTYTTIVMLGSMEFLPRDGTTRISFLPMFREKKDGSPFVIKDAETGEVLSLLYTPSSVYGTLWADGDEIGLIGDEEFIYMSYRFPLDPRGKLSSRYCIMKSSVNSLKQPGGKSEESELCEYMGNLTMHYVHKRTSEPITWNGLTSYWVQVDRGWIPAVYAYFQDGTFDALEVYDVSSLGIGGTETAAAAEDGETENGGDGESGPHADGGREDPEVDVTG